MKWFVLGSLALVASLVIALPVFYKAKLGYALREAVDIEVQAGTGFHNILNHLNKKEPKFSKFVAKIYLKLTNKENQLKFGEYHFEKGQTLEEVLNDLASGKVVTYKLTIPEGYNIFEIADLLEASEIKISKKDFLELVTNKNFIKEQLGFEASSLEGYLYPSTYDFSKQTNAYAFTKHLVQTSLEKYNHLLSQFSLPEGLDKNEVVILASVVEKETGAPEERKIIASVFLNRLKKRMRLQSDPTTIYGEWLESGERLFNIKKSHLLRNNPYNTYKIARLPEGPISNPGEKALAAVLNPEETDFLYFVSKNDGRHYFSKTYKEHLNAVRKFQMKKSAREGKSWRDLKKN